MRRCLKTSKAGRSGRLGEVNRLYCELKRPEDEAEAGHRLERDREVLADREASPGRVVDEDAVESNFSRKIIGLILNNFCRIQTNLNSIKILL